MDKQIIEYLAAYESGVITDAMYLLGLDQWMTGVLPLKKDYRMCGRAFTIKYTQSVCTEAIQPLGVYAVLEQLKPGDVVVMQVGVTDGAILGDNLVTFAERRGAAGVVLDAPTRDSVNILKLNTPCFTAGRHLRVAKEMVISAFQVPVMCGGIIVNPGDYIVGDIDGVMAVPQNRAQDVLYQAERLDQIEREMMDAILADKSPVECQALIDRKKHPRS
jgi:regulator of RNase E activity RraA